MKVRVEAAAASSGRSQLTLLDPADLKTFAILANAGADLAQVEPASVVRPGEDADSAWVSQEWVHAGWHAAGAPGGQAAFDAMISYAASQGWVDAASGEIAAHVEWLETNG